MVGTKLNYTDVEIGHRILKNALKDFIDNGKG
jgi:hypothetical protein